MKLPSIEIAEIPRAKIVDYLLSFTHRDGRSKADFFRRFGFDVDQWSLLADALRLHANDNEVSKVEQTPFGTRFVVEGPCITPDGRNPNVRSIWFVEQGETIPRFVSAYPLPKHSRRS